MPTFDRLPPRLAERYSITGRLGGGGSSTVYYARDRRLGGDVALKVSRSMSRDDGSSVRLLHEARVTALLDHPSIVRLYDHGVLDGFPYAVYEYVPGNDLRHLFDHNARSITTWRALQIGRLLAEALAHAHGRGVVHLDLKPENVLLPDPLGAAITLADFGLATARGLPESFATDGLCLTAAYASPEQAFMQAGDERSDLYALGVVLYETLCGRPPFEGDLPAALLYQHAHIPPPPPRQFVPALSDAVVRLLESLLEKQPERRPASASVVAEALAVELASEG